MDSFPLHTAVSERNCDAVAALLDAGADPNARNADGKAPLHLVFDQYVTTIDGWKMRPRAYAVLKLLLAGGADANLLDAAGRTPLLLALDRHAPAKFVRYLVAAGADPNFVCFGRTAFVDAVHSGQYESAEYLLLGGANPNAEDTLMPCIGNKRYVDAQLVQRILLHTRDTVARAQYIERGLAYIRDLKLSNAPYVSIFAFDDGFPRRGFVCELDAGEINALYRQFVEAARADTPLPPCPGEDHCVTAAYVAGAKARVLATYGGMADLDFGEDV